MQVDARMSMFLNNASESNSPVVVLLSPEMIDEQLNRACQAFVEHTFKVKHVTVLQELCATPQYLASYNNGVDAWRTRRSLLSRII